MATQIHFKPTTGRSPESDASTPQLTTPISVISILILSYHLRLGLPNDLFPSGFPTTILYAFFVSSMRATCTVHLILLDLITLVVALGYGLYDRDSRVRFQVGVGNFPLHHRV